MKGCKVVGIKIAEYEKDGVKKEGRELFLMTESDDVQGYATSSVYVGSGNAKLFALACTIQLDDVLIPIRNEYGRVDDLLVLERAKK